MIKRMFAPGCALLIYKPDLVEKIHQILNENLGSMEILTNCCQHDPEFSSPVQIINVCPGCDKRYRNDYKNSSTISLWEVLAENNFFSFPDYKGKRMSINDACPTRDQKRVQSAIRKILKKMNIKLAEPKHTKTRSTCCGDSFYGVIPTEKVKEQMEKRAAEMPSDDVVVYCVSCLKAMYIGKKNPRYLVDLLFETDTLPKTYEPDDWHTELKAFIDSH